MVTETGKASGATNSVSVELLIVYHSWPVNTRPDAHPNAVQLSCTITLRLATISVTHPLIQLPSTLNPFTSSPQSVR